MTPDAQRIAIATACGWKCAGHPDQILATKGWQFAYQFVIDPTGEIVSHNSIPDYLADLNACHEMEKVLTEDQQNIMNEILWDLMSGKKYLWHATASEKCEAFLRTLELWEEAR